MSSADEGDVTCAYSTASSSSSVSCSANPTSGTTGRWHGRFSNVLPVLIEVVDDQAHVDKLLLILDEMITGGALVTVERVRVLRYAAGQKRTTNADVG